MMIKAVCFSAGSFFTACSIIISDNPVFLIVKKMEW